MKDREYLMHPTNNYDLYCKQLTHTDGNTIRYNVTLRYEFKTMKKTIIEIERYLETLVDIGVKCTITATIRDDLACCTLYLFDCWVDDDKVEITSSCLVYDNNSDIIFTLYDWQDGRPEWLDEIADYKWLANNQDIVVMMNGLPRVL